MKIRHKGLRALHERDDRARLPADLVPRIRRILLRLLAQLAGIAGGDGAIGSAPRGRISRARWLNSASGWPTSEGPLEGLKEVVTKPVPQGSETERNVEQDRVQPGRHGDQDPEHSPDNVNFARPLSY